MGESITEGEVGSVLVKAGDVVAEDTVLAQIETDKVSFDVKYQGSVPATVKEVKFAEGDNVEVGQTFFVLEETPDAKVGAGAAKEAPKEAAAPETPKAAEAPKAAAPAPKAAAPAPKAAAPKAAAPPPPPPSHGARPERRVKMTRMRQRVAQRLKDSQNTYALLTTFNEIDMTNLMAMRKEYKDAFIETHGVKLGFMSAFVKASTQALKEVPAVNAVIDGDEIVYRDYYDISIAVATPKGLVVPVVRGADALSFAGVEACIHDLGQRGRNGTLGVDDMVGGTFTITNGGVFGSLVSTPILNPPQSAILGMHATNVRPAVVNGQIVPRALMYVALTYDHRLIDGREAVTFLKRVKEYVEDPRRLLLEV